MNRADWHVGQEVFVLRTYGRNKLEPINSAKILKVGRTLVHTDEHHGATYRMDTGHHVADPAQHRIVTAEQLAEEHEREALLERIDPRRFSLYQLSTDQLRGIAKVLGV